MPNTTEFGSEYILIFIGYSEDASVQAELLAGLEPLLQKEVDKIRSLNPAVPFHRVKIWKWNSDARIIRGGQSVVISPVLNRADIAVFVFHEMIGSVSWQELKHALGRNPPIPVLSFFNAIEPGPQRMFDERAVEQWLDLLKKSNSLRAGWADVDSVAITPLPKYQNLEHLKALASDRLITEIVRLGSKYSLGRVLKEQVFDRSSISDMGHLIHKFKAKDTSGRWAYYFVLVMPEKERQFLDSIRGTESIDLEDYGTVIASSYGESPTREVKDYLKQTYGFDV